MYVLTVGGSGAQGWMEQHGACAVWAATVRTSRRKTTGRQADTDRRAGQRGEARKRSRLLHAAPGTCCGSPCNCIRMHVHAKTPPHRAVVNSSPPQMATLTRLLATSSITQPSTLMSAGGLVACTDRACRAVCRRQSKGAIPASSRNKNEDLPSLLPHAVTGCQRHPKGQASTRP